MEICGSIQINLKCTLKGCQPLKKWVFKKKVGKSQNTFAKAEEIGCGNDLILSWICNELRQNNKNKVCSWVDGWMGEWVDGWMGGWADVKAVLRIANKTIKTLKLPV